MKETISYKGHQIERGESFVISVSPAGRMEYSQIVRLDGEHEVCVNGMWELLNSVDRAKEIVDQEEESKVPRDQNGVPFWQ